MLAKDSAFAPLGKSLGAKYNVSAAQIALGWIGQPAQYAPTGPMAMVTRSSLANLSQHTVPYNYILTAVYIQVTKSSNPKYLSEDLDLWGWPAGPIGDLDREQLDKVDLGECKEEAPGGCCKMA